ncbi:MAG: hypothetical protein QXJ21_06730 [Thermofilum sp.]
METEGVVIALKSILERRHYELQKGSSNWLTAYDDLLSDLADIARMFRCYEVTEAYMMLIFGRLMMKSIFESMLVEEVKRRIENPKYSIPEPFKTMFLREVQRLNMDDFDVDLIPQLGKLGERLTSVKHLLEAAKVYGTGHEYHLLTLLIDSSKPAISLLNEIFAKFLQEAISELKSKPSPTTFKGKASEFVKMAHRRAHGWPES